MKKTHVQINERCSRFLTGYARRHCDCVAVALNHMWKGHVFWSDAEERREITHTED